MRNRNDIEALKETDFEHLTKEKDTCEMHKRAVGILELAVHPTR